MIQRSLDGFSLLIPVFDEKTPTIADSFLNPLTRLNQIAESCKDSGEFLIKLASEMKQFEKSLFTKPIKIVKIAQKYYTIDQFVEFVPIMRENPTSLKIFTSACDKNVHISDNHHLKLYTYTGRNASVLIQKYQRYS